MALHRSLGTAAHRLAAIARSLVRQPCRVRRSRHARPADAADGGSACVGDTGVTVVVDATNVGGGIDVRCALGRAGERVGSAEERGHTIAPIPNRSGAVCTDRRPSGRGLSHVLGDELLVVPPRAEREAGRDVDVQRRRRATTYKPAPGSVEGWKYTST